MKFALAALAAVGTLGAVLVSPAPAQARFFGGHALEAPSLVDTAQVCRTRTVRTVSRGRVTVRTVRDCSPRFRPVPSVTRRVILNRPNGCRDVQTRTRSGNRFVIRTVRRCF